MAEARSRKSKGRNAGGKSASAARGNRAASESKATKRSQGGARKGAAQSRSRTEGGRSARKTGASNARSGGSALSSGGKSTAGRTTGSRSTVSRKSASRQSGARASSGTRAAERPQRRGKMDALSLLKQDHDMVDEMFRKYDRMKHGDERKSELRERIVDEIRVHAQVEEEIFYPALENAADEGSKEAELIHEAHVEHDTVKWLIEQIEGASGDEEKTDACVKVMGEYIRHHVEEEEGQIFRAARKASLDLEALGRQMDARKRELKGEPPADADAMAEGGLQVLEPARIASASTRH
jgi:hypothetical protein